MRNILISAISFVNNTKKGSEIYATFAKRLINLSYERTDLVESRGEFAIRGGIIDLFPPQLEHPIRIDMFDDEIESIHTFSISDQRSIEGVTDLVEILPCKELPANQVGQLIIDRLPKNSKTIFIERDRCASRVAELLATDEEFRKNIHNTLDTQLTGSI